VAYRKEQLWFQHADHLISHSPQPGQTLGRAYRDRHNDAPGAFLAHGLDSGKHSASLQRGSPGVLHGNRTYILQDENGQITETHSISAGLDYPGVGPEHAWLKDIGRAEYVGITDTEALSAFHYLCRTEGIIPALESAHAIAYAMKLAATMKPDQKILVNLSGRGDKDIGTVADLAGVDFYDRPSMRGLQVKGGKS